MPVVGIDLVVLDLEPGLPARATRVPGVGVQLVTSYCEPGLPGHALGVPVVGIDLHDSLVFHPGRGRHRNDTLLNRRPGRPGRSARPAVASLPMSVPVLTLVRGSDCTCRLLYRTAVWHYRSGSC